MIFKSTITKTLTDLDRLFNKESNPTKQLFYSKLALMELCGWIEITMDAIIEKAYKKNISQPCNIKIVQSIIKKNSNLHYDTNFKSMLTYVIGLSLIEKIENQTTPSKLVPMKSTLESLRGSRNSAAHTFIKGITQNIDAPSVTKANFIIILDGFKDFVLAMKKLHII